MLVVGHDHGNMAVGSIVLSVVPIGKLIGTRKSEFAGTPPLTQAACPGNPPVQLESRSIRVVLSKYIFAVQGAVQAACTGSTSPNFESS